MKRVSGISSTFLFGGEVVDNFAEKSRYTLLILIEESIGKAENESAFEVRLRFEEIKKKRCVGCLF